MIRFTRRIYVGIIARSAILVLAKSEEELRGDIELIGKFGDILLNKNILHPVLIFSVQPRGDWIRDNGKISESCIDGDVFNPTILPNEIESRAFSIRRCPKCAGGTRQVVSVTKPERTLRLSAIFPIIPLKIGPRKIQKAPVMTSAITGLARGLLNAGIEPNRIQEVLSEIGYPEIKTVLTYITVAKGAIATHADNGGGASNQPSDSFDHDYHPDKTDLNYYIPDWVLDQVDTDPCLPIADPDILKVTEKHTRRRCDWHKPNEIMEEKGYFRSRHYF